MPRIWLCADDYGISPGVNTGIRDLAVRGRLNATSVLVVAPSCYRSEAMLLDALNRVTQRVAIGLHVALTAPFRPLSAGFAPLRKGVFLPLSASVQCALLHRFDAEGLTRELNHQLDAFSRLFGRLPDFIDGHQHVHLLPQIRDAVLRATKERAPNVWLRQCGRIEPLRRRLADPKGFFLDLLSRGFRRRAVALGLRTNPAFAGTYDFAEDADFSALFARFLERLPDDSVVMCHPGFVDAELQRLDPVTRVREREHEFLAGDAFLAMLASHGVTLGVP